MAIDTSMAFAPVRASLSTAPLGTSVLSIVGTGALPVTFEDHGSIDLATGYSFTPAGTPTRSIYRSYWDREIFHVSETPSDDSPTWDVVFYESNIVVIEEAFGATIDATGKLVYVGGIPDHRVMVLDLADASGLKTRRFVVPDTSIALNGSINPTGDKDLETYPLQFSANPTTGALGTGVTGLFAMWSSWLINLS
jgi:hypothetical protein